MKTALIFDCYDDYEIRIKYIKEAMIRAGYTVHVFFADFDHYSKKYTEKKREGIEYLHAESYEKNLSYARIHSHLLFSKTCVKKAEEYSDVSLIYAMVPPNSMCKDFAIYHRKHPDIKLMFDLCDMWPESLPVSKTIEKLGSPVFHAWRRYRDAYIGEADCVLSECNLFAGRVQPYVNEERLHPVYLCQEHHGSIMDPDQKKLSFLYCGSMNHIINIDMMASFLREANKYKSTVLHLIGNGEQKERLINQIKEAGTEVVDHGTVYDEDQKQKIYRQCQYGLNLMVDSVFVGLTMKSLDYMSHDLPLISNIKGDTWDLVEKEHIGINVTEGKEAEAAKEITEADAAQYQGYRRNTQRVFKDVFDQSIINKQLDKILEDL